MKKVVLGIVAVAVLVGGYFLFASNNDRDVKGVEESAGVNSEGKKMAFASFIKQGGDYKCTVNQHVDGTDSSGVVYISDSMVRGEFQTQTQGMTIDSTFVSKDGFSYSWTSMMPGTVYKVKVMESADDSSAPTSSNYGFNAENIGDYDCKPSSNDKSLFEVPSSAIIVDISAKA